MHYILISLTNIQNSVILRILRSLLAQTARKTVLSKPYKILNSISKEGKKMETVTSTQLTEREKELIRGSYEARGFKVVFGEKTMRIFSKKGSCVDEIKNIFFISLMRGKKPNA